MAAPSTNTAGGAAISCRHPGPRLCRTHVGVSVFDESLHPRGQAANVGQFASKSNGSPVGVLAAAEQPSDKWIVAQDVSTQGTMYRWAGVEPAAGWPGVTTADREVFTTRHCAVLADALHARTGWPIVGFGDGPNGVIGWVHAGVLAPGGLIVDVDGVHEPADWAERWGQFADSFGRDELEYDWDAVWAYRAEAFGWGGRGAPFSQETTPEVARQAARAADAILTQWNGRW